MFLGLLPMLGKPNSLDTRPHKRQVEETMDTLSEGPEGFYKSYLG